MMDQRDGSADGNSAPPGYFYITDALCGYNEEGTVQPPVTCHQPDPLMDQLISTYGYALVDGSSRPPPMTQALRYYGDHYRTEEQPQSAEQRRGAARLRDRHERNAAFMRAVPPPPPNNRGLLIEAKDTKGMARRPPGLPRQPPPPPPTVPGKGRAPQPPGIDKVQQIDDGGKQQPIYNANSTVSSDTNRGWDVFRSLPPPPDKFGEGFWLDASLQLLKVSTFVVLFLLTLFTAVVAKAGFLLMTSAIGKGGRNTTICRHPEPLIEDSVISMVEVERRHVVKWVWSVFLALCLPELICFIRCLHRILFRNVKKPTLVEFVTVLVTETLQALGVGLLVFRLLPELDAATGAMLTNCLCFVPAVLTLLARKPTKVTCLLVVFDAAAIAAQSSGFWAWPMFIPQLSKHSLAVPIALTLISVGWWRNFVHQHSVFPPIRALARFSNSIGAKTSKTYAVVSLWKCAIYLLAVFLFTTSSMSMQQLLEPHPFGEKPIKVYAFGVDQETITAIAEQKRRMEEADYSYHDGGDGDDYDETGDYDYEIDTNPSGTINEPSDAGGGGGADGNGPMVIDTHEFNQEFLRRLKRQASEAAANDDSTLPPTAPTTVTQTPLSEVYTETYYTTPYDALWLVLVQTLAVCVCYQTSKFACKVMMQRIGFAFPMALTVPLTVAALNNFCANRAADPCYLSRSLPFELFWRCYSGASEQSLFAFMASPQTLIWLCWLCSQLWVTVHLWAPKHERLARSDRLFILPWYNAAFADQSLALNRRKDDKSQVKTEDVEFESDDVPLYDTFLPGVGGGMSAPPTEGSICSSTAAAGRAVADSITKIYACATMWHENPIEMTCMLKSLFRLDEDQCARRNAQKYLKIVDPDYYEFEAHVFFDDAFEMNEYGEPVMNNYVKQLIEKVDEAASTVHQTTMRLKPPKKVVTPYGGKIVYLLPGKNKLCVHLKDKSRIRHRKRWSQVMYLYYLLGFRLMQKVEDNQRKENIGENTFILTLDGDVDFKPQAVRLLVDLMKKNRKLGAACGRIHPRGSGPMMWYQKFEYAVGHWLQKSTEHMIGCVLCAPGVFSLFRSCALMDDNVARRYAAKSENPKDYIQYDQGEDRWLCTLLLQRGYRVEYCAASDALTFAPEGFSEFFNQRRRWIPSTLANVINLLTDYRNVIKVNESISIIYIFYQFLMLMSSILGPGTIFLMVVGALAISFNINTSLAFLFVLIPIVLFSVVCLTCKPDKQEHNRKEVADVRWPLHVISPKNASFQLVVAQIIGALFAMLMTTVIVGTALQIKKDGMYSPHAIFLFSLVGSFIIAAILHPLEFTCVVPGLLYFMAIPCMYMLLPIYSLCNLHVVSWGTREGPIGQANSNNSERNRQKRLDWDLVNGSALGGVNEAANDEMDGVCNLGCGSLCRVMCCVQSVQSSPQVLAVSSKIEHLDQKLDRLDKRLNGGERRRTPQFESRESRFWDDNVVMEEEDEVLADHHFDAPKADLARHLRPQSETWLGERCLKRAEREQIDPDEESFWKEMVDKYLQPLKLDRKEAERVQLGLVELRNKISFAFFMLNALFILIVFLLQLKKDCLHIEWPFGPKTNHTIVPCYTSEKEEIWVYTRLQLEPIGLVFLTFFISILVIQFIAMLLHRFSTMAHIIASTDLFCFRKAQDKLSEDELVVQNAVEIAKELQAIRGIDEENEESPTTEEPTISRRRVVAQLESSRRSMMKRRTETLDAAFRKRFFALSDEIGDSPAGGGGFRQSMRRNTLSRGTIRALQNRRDSLFAGSISGGGDATLDKKSGARLIDASADVPDDEPELPPPPPGSPPTQTALSRGPAKRRLERLFHDNQLQTTTTAAEIDGDSAAKGDAGMPTSNDDMVEDSAGDTLRTPPLTAINRANQSGAAPNLRKAISQAVWNEGRVGGIVDAGPTTDSKRLLESQSSGSVSPESRF